MKQKITKGKLVTEDRLEEILDGKFDERFVQQDEKMRQYKDELLNALVDIVAQLDDTRVDRDLAVGQTRELTVRVGNHEKRLQVLEKH